MTVDINQLFTQQRNGHRKAGNYQTEMGFFLLFVSCLVGMHSSNVAFTVDIEIKEHFTTSKRMLTILTDRAATFRARFNDDIRCGSCDTPGSRSQECRSAIQRHASSRLGLLKLSALPAGDTPES